MSNANNQSRNKLGPIPTTAQPDVGRKYEISVTTLVAAILSNNTYVESYQVFTNLQEARPFDDVVVKVFFRGENVPHAYAMQVKYLRKGETLDVEKYFNCYKKILNNGGFITIGDIAVDNIHFCYFGIRGVRTMTDYTLRAHNPTSEPWRSVLPLQYCHKLSYNKAINEMDKERDFLDKFYLYLNQPDINQIKKEIMLFCKINDANNILKYVDMFFENSILWQRGLSKEIFETELLKLRLEEYILSPTAIIQLNDSHAALWNKLILQHNVTIVKAEANIEKSLFGCMALELNHLLGTVIDWKNYNTNTLDSAAISDIQQIFRKLANEKARYTGWIDPPTTLKSLIMELWIWGDLPLILKSDDDLPVLKDFAHLNKSYIIITDNLVGKQQECESYDLKTLTYISDIKCLEKRDELLKTIPVSIQGRKPTSLYSVVNNHEELTKTLSCSDILHLMKARKAYLRKDYVDDDHDDNIIFLIEDSNSSAEYDIDGINMSVGNIAIWCGREKIAEYRKQIERNPKLRCYDICHCVVSSANENFTLVEGNKLLLRDFFVDQDGESVYNLEDDIVPILGNTLQSIQKNYIARFLRSAVVSKSLFDAQTKGICFFSGNLNYLDVVDIKVNMIKEQCEKLEEIKQLSNENVFINIEDEDITQYWNKASAFKRPLLYIRLEEIGMQLCRSNDWKGLSDHISFSGREIPEESFLTEISDGITIVTGEPGIGKSSLLRSLFENHGNEKYILFYNLAQYKSDRKKSLATLSSLDFILNKFKTTRYGEFLSNLFQPATEKLLVILDSFDEVLASWKGEVLNFIRNLATNNIQIIIASRLIANSTLMDNFETSIFKVDILRADDRREYVRNSYIPEDVLTATPHEFLENPLYLNFLKIISENSGHLASIGKLDLYGNIIRIRLNQYFENYLPIGHVSDNEDPLEHVLELHRKLALVRILGVDIVEELLKWKYETGYANQLKLGIIISIDEDSYPTFEHETFAEYLTADWIIRNKVEDSAKNIYVEMLKQKKLYVLDIICEHLALHKAILEKDEGQIATYAKDGSHLERTDDLDRMGIHMAAAHHKGASWDWSPIDPIIRNMREFNINFTRSDLLMGWDWVQHLNQGNNVDLMLCNRFAMPAKAAYLNCIVQKLRMGVRLRIDLEAYAISPLYMEAMEEGRIDMIRDLFFIEDAVSNGISAASKHQECQALEAHTIELRKIKQLTPLHVACIYGNVEAVKELMRLKHEVNATDSFGCLPIHYSVINPYEVRMDMTKILLENGSKTDTENRRGKTAVGVAVCAGNLDITELFSQKGAPVLDSIEKDMKKLLFHAVDTEDENMMMLLFKHQLEAKTRSKALTQTSSASSSDVVGLFLEGACRDDNAPK